MLSKPQDRLCTKIKSRIALGEEDCPHIRFTGEFRFIVIVNPILSNVLSNTITKDLFLFGQENQNRPNAKSFNQLAEQAGLELKRKYILPKRTLLQEISRYPTGLKAGPAHEISNRTVEMEPPRNNWVSKRLKPIIQLY